MYKLTPQYQQISIFDFNQPGGLQLSSDNRWVQLADSLEWSKYEELYAEQFPSKTGRPGIPFRIAFGAYIIQKATGASDRKLCELIAENPYYQYFLGLPSFQSECLFTYSAMVHFRKRFTPEFLMEVNEMILAASDVTPEHREDKLEVPDGTALPDNMGTLILDATCSPSNIRYPQDFSLLNEAREHLEGIIDYFNDTYHPWAKPRTYREIARKDYLKLAKSKRRSAKAVRMQIRRELFNLARDMRYIEQYLAAGYELPEKYRQLYQTIQKLYEQQKYMYDHKTHRIEHRIVSLRQPHLRPIVRGKVKAPVEFGAKYDVSIDEKGHARMEKLSFDPYNEGGILTDAVERYKTRTGHYPTKVLVDQIYRTRTNREFCKQRGIRMSGPRLGRPPKEKQKPTKEEYQDNVDRIEVERFFSLDKHCYGAGLIMTKLPETTLSSITMSVLVGNLFRIPTESLFLLYFVDSGAESESQHYMELAD